MLKLPAEIRTSREAVIVPDPVAEPETDLGVVL